MRSSYAVGARPEDGHAGGSVNGRPEAPTHGDRGGSVKKREGGGGWVNQADRGGFVKKREGGDGWVNHDDGRAARVGALAPSASGPRTTSMAARTAVVRLPARTPRAQQGSCHTPSSDLRRAGIHPPDIGATKGNRARVAAPSGRRMSRSERSRVQTRGEPPGQRLRRFSFACTSVQ